MERFKLGDIDNERYYQIPKSLFTNARYKKLSLNAKVIYSFLKDRFNLSRKNKWVDTNGDIFLLFTHAEMAKLLNVSEATTKRAINELKEFELIHVVRQGLSKPNKIYINKIPPADTSRSCTNDTSRSCANDTSRSCTDDTLMNLTLNELDLSETESKDITPIVPIQKCQPSEKRFEEFWRVYPRKVGKGAAEKAFKRIKPDSALHDKIMCAIHDAKMTRQWRENNGQFIPNPATWLNQRRWEDEPEFNRTLASPQEDMANEAIAEIMRNG